MVVSHSPFTAIAVQAREFALKVCSKNTHYERLLFDSPSSAALSVYTLLVEKVFQGSFT